ncbi:MAG: DNA gyrase subunit A, partial [Erysipelotrichaceae bacterium]|nr:DNA gyrase subunit A [Erysipelotrichaceae bacterium]
VITLKSFEEGKYLFMATRSGIVKRTSLLDYANVRKKGLTAIVLKEEDELIDVALTDGRKEILLVTTFGQCIRFRETDVRCTGRVSMGVIGINLADQDRVVSMLLADEGEYMLTASEKGMGKRTLISEFSVQNRGGKGVRCYRIMEKTGNLIGALEVDEDNEIMMINSDGIIIRMNCSDISVVSRITSGVKLMNLNDKDVVACIAKVKEEKDL